jgi:hypothetical protein
MVFDPTTGDQANATGRCVFSYNGQVNVLPQSAADCRTQRFWPRRREPRIAGTVTRNMPFKRLLHDRSAVQRNIGIAKVDWNRSDRHTIWGK